MHLKIEYITDKKGKHKSVIIPNKQWENFEAEYYRMKNKVAVLVGISKALQEVKQIQHGKKRGKSLREVLNEL
ncbi:MAG: hypothetical protein L0Y79_13330 [Chlorobi bacterium]|nr:hypothetical protein [Chlorobiota bacterium]MCI0716247.1 hypothetical protein [Chlorobiota bacterium]